MLRFSIREILLTTLVVGLILGWWIDHTRLQGYVQVATSKSEKWKFFAESAKEMLAGFGLNAEWKEDGVSFHCIETGVHRDDQDWFDEMYARYRHPMSNTNMEKGISR